MLGRRPTGLELFPLRPDQSRIVRHPARVKVISAGRRFGKSYLCGAISLATAAAGGKVCWWVPTYKNARPVWQWVEQALGALERSGGVRLNRSERTVRFTASGGYLAIFSGDNDVAGRGDWWNLAVLDEASRMREETWTEVVQPSLADADGQALLPSTPMGKNWYWKLWQEGYARMDGEVAAFTAPSYANPMPTIQRAYALAKQRVPENVFRQEWDAEFVASASQTFLLDEWWDETPAHSARRFDATDPRLQTACVARWISWDTGFKDTDSSAYTACVVGELTADYRLLIREVWRDQLTFPNLVDQITRVAERYAQDYTGVGAAQRRVLRAVVIEDKASGISAVQTLRETAPDWLAELIVPFQPQGSKEQRAALAAVWCKDGCVWLPHPSEAVRWLADFEQELTSFPSGPFKDQVDATTQLILYCSRYLNQGRTARLAAAQQLTLGTLDVEQAAPADGLAA